MFQPITELSFTGGGFLVAASHFPNAKPNLSVWDLMTFGLLWSYRLSIEGILDISVFKKILILLLLLWSYYISSSCLFAAIATEAKSPYFAVLTELPGSYRSAKSNEEIFRGKDGAILLFDGSGPKPVAIWTVMKV